MAARLSERCRRICGTMSEDCFIKNQNQILCLSDMVINKISGILVIVESAAEKNQRDESRQFFDEALRNMRELLNWVKFLQVAHDLRVPSLLAYETNVPEKRKQTRYPLPEVYHKYIVMKINISGSFVSVLLTNFSQGGMQFKSPEPLDIDAIKECLLHTTHMAEKEAFFTVRIKYCANHNGEYLIGAEIEEISDSITFDFFNNVYDFMVEMMMKAEIVPTD
ncbi:MAG: PilZ domain-containing protein [Thermodesulfovibrionales bacterium]